MPIPPAHTHTHCEETGRKGCGDIVEGGREDCVDIVERGTRKRGCVEIVEGS